MATIQPLGDRVLVESGEPEEVTIGGIILPDSAKVKPNTAKVVALGTGGIDKDGNKIEFHIAVGDTVYLPQYGGSEAEIDGKEYKIFSQSDILAVIK